MKISRMLLPLLFLLMPVFIQTVLALDSDSGRAVIRKLTQREVAIPAGRHNNYSIASPCEVNYPSPKMKPVIDWKQEFYAFTDASIFVDSKGNIWHVFPREDEFSEHLTLLDPGGNVFRELKTSISDCIPMIMCEDAIVVSGRSFFGSGRDIYLECVDLDGNTLWRTEPTVSNVINPNLWRISGDRVMLTVGDDNSGIFNIYSLYDGELLDTIKIPEWDVYPFTIEPLETSDGGWIGFQMDKIVCFSSDFTQLWSYDVPDTIGSPFTSVNPPMPMPDGDLMLGTTGSLVRLGGKTGKETFRRDGMFFASGITSDGSYIFSAVQEPDVSLEELKSKDSVDEVVAAFQPIDMLLVVDENGETVLSSNGHDRFVNRGMDTIQYNDGSILFGCRDNLTLIDKFGQVVWSMDKSEFGVFEKAFHIKWSINPGPDDRIVVTIENANEFHGPIMYSLAQPDRTKAKKEE